MSKINYKKILERIVESTQEKLNNWEIDFISNQYQWHVLDDNSISDAVKKKILQINGKYLGR